MLDDAALLRNLAEDVPDMAPSVREHLRAIAATLEKSGVPVGVMRCRRCGDEVRIVIHCGEVKL